MADQKRQEASPVRVIVGSLRAASRVPLGCREIGHILEQLLRQAQSLAGQGQCEAAPGHVDLLITDDVAIASLNRQAMGVVGPTNILSFPGCPLASGAELALSVDTLLRECMLYGQTPERYLLRLLAHGTGHICGFDHGGAMDAFCAQLEAALVPGTRQ